MRSLASQPPSPGAAPAAAAAACRLHLKGAPGEEAVLCSGSKTFAVKTVETTNLLLLVPEEQTAAVEAAVEALGCQDVTVPQPTPPGVLLGLGTQIQKVHSPWACLLMVPELGCPEHRC